MDDADRQDDSAATLPRFALATEGMPAAAAFEQWRATIAPVFDVGLADDTEIGQFDVAFEAFDFGALLLGRTRGRGAQTFERDTPTVGRSGVDHILVQAYVGGRNHVAAEGRDLMVATGDVWLYDMTRTLSATSVDFTNVSLAVPRALIEPLVADGDALHGLKLGGDTSLGGLLYDHIRGIEARASHLTRREAEAIAASTVHLLAGCAGAAAAARDAVEVAMSNAWLTRLRRDIDADLGNPDLGPDLLIRRHRLSRARLYRLFEPIGGVADFIRQRRLRRVFLDLIAPACRDRPIAEIAQRWGFANEATFGRAFRAHYGRAPSEVRHMGLGGSAAATRSAVERSQVDRWMHDLAGR